MGILELGLVLRGTTLGLGIYTRVMAMDIH